ncbi:MAG: DnaJ domain-containing protein [Pyrinomonadaceae bacterium]|nr:DnaJ domain-containing protein [Pyrinomonadaceae bacterium]
MESSNSLEIKGSLQTNPLAELLHEIARHQFNGSLRLSNETNKTVIYFDAGETIFAVSNARRHRLFEMLLQMGKINQDQLLVIADFTSDAALKDNLLKKNLLNKSEIDALFKRQIGDILQTAALWETGEWIFSPLVRLKNEMRFEIVLNKLLIDLARTLPAGKAAQKFRNAHEAFSAITPMPVGINLSPHEWFVYSRFENSAFTRDEIQSLSGLPETATFQILYSLWLGGFVKRQNYHAAFSERYVSAVVSARLAVVKNESKPIFQTPKQAAPSAVKIESIEVTETPVEEIAAVKPISLEEYLVRVESATNYYEIFALPHDVATPEIKKTYFGLAKRFHPDLFRKEARTALHQRIQNAFTKLARAYDTLKGANLREVYDFKMRKEIAEMVERQKTGATREEADTQKQVAQAAENFEQGFNYLMNEEYEAAIPCLARAVFFAPDNARFHAYYGKALAADARQQHRAEAELQTAVKLDGQNADYRIMLAEFFIDIELLKRAEGELNRLLAIAPDNHEARRLLDSLKKK